MKRLKLWAAIAAMFAVPSPLPAQDSADPVAGGVPRTQFGQNVDNLRQSVQSGRAAAQNIQQGVQGRVDSVGQAGQNLKQAVTGNPGTVQAQAAVQGQTGLQGQTGVQGNVNAAGTVNPGTLNQGTINQGTINQGTLQGQTGVQRNVQSGYYNQPGMYNNQQYNQQYRSQYGNAQYGNQPYGNTVYGANQNYAQPQNMAGGQVQSGQVYNQPSTVYHGSGQGSVMSSAYQSNFASNRVYRLRYDAWGREFICVNGQPVYFDAPQAADANQGNMNQNNNMNQQNNERRAGYPSNLDEDSSASEQSTLDTQSTGDLNPAIDDELNTNPDAPGIGTDDDLDDVLNNPGTPTDGETPQNPTDVETGA